MADGEQNHQAEAMRLLDQPLQVVRQSAVAMIRRVRQCGDRPELDGGIAEPDEPSKLFTKRVESARRRERSDVHFVKDSNT